MTTRTRHRRRPRGGIALALLAALALVAAPAAPLTAAPRGAPARSRPQSVGRWFYVGRMSLARGLATATLLPTGGVLVAGGGGGGTGAYNTAEVYNPRTFGFSSTGSMTTPLANGWVLVAGGCYPGSDSCDGADVRSAEVYVP